MAGPQKKSYQKKDHTGRAAQAIARVALPPMQKIILLYYASALNTKRGDFQAWGGTRTIARINMIDKGTVVTNRNALVEAGHLSIMETHKDQRDGYRGGRRGSRGRGRGGGGRPSLCVRLNVQSVEALIRAQEAERRAARQAGPPPPESKG